MTCVCIGGGGPPRGLTRFWTPPRAYWSEIKQSPAREAEKACAVRVCGAVTGVGAPLSRANDRPNAVSRGASMRPPGARARRGRTPPLGRPAPGAWPSVDLLPHGAAAPAAQQIEIPSPSWRRRPVCWPPAWRPASRLPRPWLDYHGRPPSSRPALIPALLLVAPLRLRQWWPQPRVGLRPRPLLAPAGPLLSESSCELQPCGAIARPTADHGVCLVCAQAAFLPRFRATCPAPCRQYCELDPVVANEEFGVSATETLATIQKRALLIVGDAMWLSAPPRRH